MAPGNKPHGFTLIELLVVVAMIAIATATISLSMRDPQAAKLDREAERLATLFEMARAESRVAGSAVQWAPVNDNSGEQFRFSGLPTSIPLPSRWLTEPVAVEILGDRPLISLGPEPMIGAQRLRLRLGQERRLLATDGLSPFEISSESP